MPTRRAFARWAVEVFEGRRPGSCAVLAGQRSSDHHRGEEIAPGLIAVQFPDLAGSKVARLETGWEHELCTAGGESIVRSARRAERAAWLSRELQITAIVAETLGPVIPIFEPIGEPCDAFPDPFAGCRRLPGPGADPARAGGLAGPAADIGAPHSRLHRVPPSSPSSGSPPVTGSGKLTHDRR